MDCSFLDNLSNFSWDQDRHDLHLHNHEFEHFDHNQVIAPFIILQHKSALNLPCTSPSKLFCVFLHVFSEETSNSISKQFYSINIKLSLMTTITSAISQLLSEFDITLKKNNALFSLSEDPKLWEIKIAKKTGFPKDYIPAIDSESLIQSVEKFDSLVLCPLNQETCVIKMTTSSSSNFSCTTKDSSKQSSPIAQQDESLGLDSKEFEESKSGSSLTNSTLSKSDLPRASSFNQRELHLSHYKKCSLLEEIDQKYAKKQVEIPKQTNQKPKSKGFFSMFCC